MSWGDVTAPYLTYNLACKQAEVQASRYICYANTEKDQYVYILFVMDTAWFCVYIVIKTHIYPLVNIVCLPPDENFLHIV